MSAIGINERFLALLEDIAMMCAEANYTVLYPSDATASCVPLNWPSTVKALVISGWRDRRLQSSISCTFQTPKSRRVRLIR